MTELDLGLKARTRELFWLMGLSARVDVPLRTFVPVSQGRGSKTFESFTDLDVLGVAVAPDFSVRFSIADCKTSAKGATERVFWTQGVREFFGADEAVLVRQHEVPAAARQLASKSGLSIATPPELDLLIGWHSQGSNRHRIASEFLFDPEAISNYRITVNGVEKPLRPLVEYLGFDYWMYEPHRNLQQLVAHVRAAGPSLKPANPAHVALFFEAAWLYSLAIVRAVRYARQRSIGDLPGAIREYLFGGQLGLREKQEIAKLFGELSGRDRRTQADVFPTYLAGIIELATRFARRPQSIPGVLRYSEWIAEAHVAQQAQNFRTAFNGDFDDLAAKLLGDVCGFLVTSCGLDKDFRNYSRSLLAPADPTDLEEETADAHTDISVEGPSDSVGVNSATPGNASAEGVRQPSLMPPSVDGAG